MIPVPLVDRLERWISHHYFIYGREPQRLLIHPNDFKEATQKFEMNYGGIPINVMSESRGRFLGNNR